MSSRLLQLYPAIDLMDGKCVRLTRGEAATKTVYGLSPADQARAFVDEGATYLHIVDLDGAFEGSPVNFAAIRAIREAVSIRIQLGGGIRSEEFLKQAFDLGINRIIVGTVALEHPAEVTEWIRSYPGRIAISGDFRDGVVAARGWTTESSIKVSSYLERMDHEGLAAFIMTDINRDGTGTGANRQSVSDWANRVRAPVVLSGGVGKLDEIREAAQDPNISGIILGKSIYEGRFSLSQAITSLEEIEVENEQGRSKEA